MGNEQALCGSVRISRRDTLDENLGLVIDGQASVLIDVRNFGNRLDRRCTPATGEMSHGCVPFFRKSIFSKRPESAYEPYEDWSA